MKQKILNIDTSPDQLRNALYVANLTKLQLGKMLNIKPQSDNRKPQLRNAKLRQLIRVGSSPRSLVETQVSKEFKKGWYNGRITDY